MKKNEIKDKLDITTANEILANQLGIEPDDISIDDSMSDDLHMKPSDIIDYIQRLGEEGAEISDLDLTDIATLGDLYEMLNLD